MTKANFDTTFEIYLFTEELAEDNFSKLSEFISFLKFNKHNLPYKFSYVGRGDALIPELTLNENILMDFSPSSLTASRDIQFQDFLEEIPNEKLFKLYQKIASSHVLPINADAQMKKICSLIKALIFEGQFIFLEDPETGLDQETLALFIDGLRAQITQHKQNVFIFSRHTDLWMPHADRHVKREKDYSFSITTVAKNWKWKEDREKFYNLKNNQTDSSGKIDFHLPKSVTKKISPKKVAA